MRKILKNFAFFYLLFLMLISLFSGILAGNGVFDGKKLALYPYSAYDIDKTAFLSPPSKKHILGTDGLGRDILARLIKGTYNSFLVSFIATAVSLFIGCFLGGISGYLGGWPDFIFSRIFELFYSVPMLFVLILLSPIIGNNIVLFALVLGFIGWLFTARLVRGEVIKLKENQFVEYAKANGASFFHLFKNHFFPHIFPVMLPIAIFGFSGMLIAESSLSFLGMGIKAPEPSWGKMILDGFSYLGIAPWTYIPPSLLLFFTVLSLDIIGEYYKKKFSRF